MRAPLIAGLVFLAGACGEAPTSPASSALLANGAPASVRGAESVPFRGRGTGTDSDITFEASGIRILADASGEATGVGRFTERLDYVLSYDLVNFGGTATITAADGSLVFLAFTGTIPGFAAQQFPLAYSVDYSIVGGTKRFAGSTGFGKLEGTDFGGGAFSFSFDGQRSIGH